MHTLKDQPAEYSVFQTWWLFLSLVMDTMNNKNFDIMYNKKFDIYKPWYVYTIKNFFNFFFFYCR